LAGWRGPIRPTHTSRGRRNCRSNCSGPDAKNLSPEERKARFAEFRDQVKQLTPDQKRELSAPMREKQKAEMDRYFAMSPKGEDEVPRRRIDRSEKMRKEREQKAAQGNAGGLPGAWRVGGGPGGNKTGAPGGTPAGTTPLGGGNREANGSSSSNGRLLRSGP